MTAIIKITCGKNSIEFYHRTQEKEPVNAINSAMAEAKRVGNIVFNPRGNINRHELEINILVHNEDF